MWLQIVCKCNGEWLVRGTACAELVAAAAARVGFTVGHDNAQSVRCGTKSSRMLRRAAAVSR